MEHLDRLTTNDLLSRGEGEKQLHALLHRMQQQQELMRRELLLLLLLLSKLQRLLSVTKQKASPVGRGPWVGGLGPPMGPPD